MWTLSCPGEAWRLPPGSTLTVGRKSCDITCAADASISRRHAVIAVAVHADLANLSARPEVTLRDDGGRYGTFVRGRKLQPKAGTPVSEGDEIRIGTTTFSLTWRPLVVSSKQTTAETKARLCDVLQSVGGHLTKDLWEATHCITDNLSPSTVFVTALARCIPVVSLSWFEALAELPRTSDQTPDCAKHLPPLADEKWRAYLPASRVRYEPALFLPDPLRRGLLRGVSAVFIDSDSWVTGRDVAAAADAAPIDCSSSDLSDPDTCRAFRIRHRDGAVVIGSGKPSANAAAVAAAGFTVRSVRELMVCVLAADSSVLKDAGGPALLTPTPGTQVSAASPEPPVKTTQGVRFMDFVEDAVPGCTPHSPKVEKAEEQGTPARPSPARRSPARPSPAGRSPARRSPARRSPARRSPARPKDAGTAADTFLTLGSKVERARTPPPSPHPAPPTPALDAGEPRRRAPQAFADLTRPVALPDLPCYRGTAGAPSSAGGQKTFRKQALAPAGYDRAVVLQVFEKARPAREEAGAPAEEEPDLMSMLELQPHRTLKRRAPAAAAPRRSSAKRRRAAEPDDLPDSMQVVAGLLAQPQGRVPVHDAFEDPFALT